MTLNSSGHTATAASSEASILGTSRCCSLATEPSSLRTSSICDKINVDFNCDVCFHVFPTVEKCYHQRFMVRHVLHQMEALWCGDLHLLFWPFLCIVRRINFIRQEKSRCNGECWAYTQMHFVEDCSYTRTIVDLFRLTAFDYGGFCLVRTWRWGNLVLLVDLWLIFKSNKQKNKSP